MPKYEITMLRISTQERVFTVEAADEDEATDKAFDEAGDYLYHEVHAEYELEDILEVVEEE